MKTIDMPIDIFFASESMVTGWTGKFFYGKMDHVNVPKEFLIRTAFFITVATFLV